MGSVRLLRFIDALLRVIVKALLALFRVFSSFWHNSTKGVRLPPITEPLLRVSAVQLARNIRRKQVTSVSVVQAYIDRIQEVNPLINALVKDRFAAALQEAAQVDKLIEEESGGEDVLEDRLPLLGVPITVKEAIAMQGMPNSTGLLSRKTVVSGVDATVVALLKRAGAIPLGVTNCSELAMWVESHNYLYGITKNPYDLTRIAGGSSGGEGSIIGSGASVIGVGSDIGGSIRMPCFFNGIYGHKPTSGIVSNAGQFPPASGQQVDFLCTGPMCRYAEDLVPLLRIMAGSNVEKLSLSTNVDLRKLRFFSVPHAGRTLIYSPVDQQLIQIQKKVVERLEADLGVQVQELYIPELKYSFQIWEAMMSAPGKDGKPPTTFAKLMGGGEKKVWPLWELCKWFLGLSSHTMPAIGLALAEMFQSSVPSQFILEKKESLQKELEEMLGTDGVMLYPPHPHLAPRHHEPLLTPFNFSYTGIFNILGLPVTQCPLGLSDEGLPLGVQLVAGKLQDHLTLATAQYLEQTFGGWREPGATEHTPPNSTSNNGNEPN